LRADNAGQLTDKGIALGCVGALAAGARGWRPSVCVNCSVRVAHANEGSSRASQQGRPAARRLRAAVASHIGVGRSPGWPRFGELAPNIAEQLEIDAKYDVYLSRQAADIASYRRDESLELPDGLDYAQLRGLSNEARQKLQASRPRSIGQAARLDGITPAALTLLVAHLKRRRHGSRTTRPARS
jgi:tRNA uridine 5-carboxymethylaminomethyl modification enzyme